MISLFLLRFTVHAKPYPITTVVFGSRGKLEDDVHLVEFRLCATSNLLCPQLNQVLLEIIELLPQLLLVLAPKLGCLDLSGRLQKRASVNLMRKRFQRRWVMLRTIFKDRAAVKI